MDWVESPTKVSHWGLSGRAVKRRTTPSAEARSGSTRDRAVTAVPVKAEAYTWVSLLPSSTVMVLSLVQFRKASVPMVVSFGQLRFKVVRPVQLEKA